MFRVRGYISYMYMAVIIIIGLIGAVQEKFIFTAYSVYIFYIYNECVSEPHCAPGGPGSVCLTNVDN